MSTMPFKGFAGVRLNAFVRGQGDGPPVLLLHGVGQTHDHWADVASALEMSGRHVVSLELRGHGSSEWPSDGRYAFDAFVDDLTAVLAQMPARPAIIASSFSAWMATIALGEAGADLAAALVLVDAPKVLDGSVGDALRRDGATRVSPEWDPGILDGLVFARMAERLERAAARLKLPVLVMAGSADCTEFASHFGDADIVRSEASCQLPADDRGEAFNGLLLDFLERKAPLAPPEYREGSDARTFRDALGCFATGVTIVTAMDADGTPVGLTANSFTSVSLDPPLLLVCVANNAGTAQTLRSGGRFAVNVLQIGQQPTSNRFAGKGEDRFAATDWKVGEFGTPVINGSLASFECERAAVHDGGDHFILVGRVLRAMFEPRRDPLLYFRGKYRRLHFA